MFKQSNFYETPICDLIKLQKGMIICGSVTLDQISDNTEAIEWED